MTYMLFFIPDLVASELCGQGGCIVPPSLGLVPPVPQVKDTAYVKILSNDFNYKII